MRFHHSTRRGRNRLNQHSGQRSAGHRLGAHQTLSSRWSKLTYCRETNIHFNRRLTIEPPAELQLEEEEHDDQQPVDLEQELLDILADDRTTSNEPNSHRRNRASELRVRTNQIDEKLYQLHLDEMPKEKARRLKEKSTTNTRSHSSVNPDEKRPADIQPDSNQRPRADKIDIDMETARQKLVAQVEKHPFWSNKAAKRMHLTQIEDRKIYILELISFCQRRDLEWCYEPYKGGLVASIPLKRRDSTGGNPSTGTPSHQDLSYFPTPQNSPRIAGLLQRTIEVPRPSAGGEQSCDSALDPTRCSSSADRNEGSTVPSRSIYEPMSVIERPMPSGEFVWSVDAPAHLKPEPFSGYAHSCELPNSSFVKRCHGCAGRGRIKCASCFGVGYEVCLSCSGKGTTRASAGGALFTRSNGRGGDSYSARNSTSANGDEGQDSERRGRYNDSATSGASSTWVTESCHFCHGAGQKRCWVCAGKSFNHCLGCAGVGKLRCYLNLNITWVNHRDEMILNNSDNIIPKDRLRLCSGHLLADETSDRLRPVDLLSAISRFQESIQLHSATRKLLAKHNQTCRSELLIKQRYRLTQIKCHVVGYEWKQRQGHFVIYGNEKKVYIAKYPFKSICSIT